MCDVQIDPYQLAERHERGVAQQRQQLARRPELDRRQRPTREAAAQRGGPGLVAFGELVLADSLAQRRDHLVDDSLGV